MIKEASEVLLQPCALSGDFGLLPLRPMLIQLFLRIHECLNYIHSFDAPTTILPPGDSRFRRFPGALLCSFIAIFEIFNLDLRRGRPMKHALRNTSLRVFVVCHHINLSLLLHVSLADKVRL